MTHARVLTFSFVFWLVAGAAYAAPQSHSVYFSLKDDTPENRARLVAACQKYLAKHSGTVFFAVGELADNLARSINDRDFDVALHLVFDSREAHDRYQEHPRHLEFIREMKPKLASVRVFDADLSVVERD